MRPFPHSHFLDDNDYLFIVRPPPPPPCFCSFASLFSCRGGADVIGGSAADIVRPVQRPTLPAPEPPRHRGHQGAGRGALLHSHGRSIAQAESGQSVGCQAVRLCVAAGRQAGRQAISPTALFFFSPEITKRFDCCPELNRLLYTISSYPLFSFVLLKSYYCLALTIVIYPGRDGKLYHSLPNHDNGVVGL